MASDDDLRKMSILMTVFDEHAEIDCARVVDLSASRGDLYHSLHEGLVVLRLALQTEKRIEVVKLRYHDGGEVLRPETHAGDRNME